MYESYKCACFILNSSKTFLKAQNELPAFWKSSEWKRWQNDTWNAFKLNFKLNFKYEIVEKVENVGNVETNTKIFAILYQIIFTV